MKIFLTELYFLKEVTNTYFEYIKLFEKKKEIFTEKNKNLEKPDIFFSEKYIYIYFFFQVVLLHLNNNRRDI